MTWSPKRAGFESGNSGNTSWGKPRLHTTNVLPDFKKWRSGLLFHLAKKNIPVEERPDGTLIAKFGTENGIMTPKMQQVEYDRYIDRLLEKEAVVDAV